MPEQLALGRLDNDVVAQRIPFLVGSVEKDTDRFVFECDDLLGLGDRGVVDRVDGDGNGGGVGVSRAVVGAEGEGIAAIGVRMRSVGQVRRGAGERAHGGLAQDEVSSAGRHWHRSR